MAFRSLGDYAKAVDAGQVHIQRFLKNAGTAHALTWADPTFSSGQPAYDARIGSAGKFTQSIAQRNDSIFFPGIDASMERRLTHVTMWSNQATFNGPGSVFLFDLLGYYPLIDGDSTDTQTMDNTDALPRYADGKGVQIVIINHIAPAVQTGVAIIEYVDEDDAVKTVTTQIGNQGQNLVCSGQSNTTVTSGPVQINLAGNKGVKRINSITYTTPPGGLHCFYLIKPLTSLVLGDNLLATEKDYVSHNGLHAPRIYDGAWLSFFDRIGTGTARSVNWFGHFTFMWN
jgi:hypothetical protein